MEEVKLQKQHTNYQLTVFVRKHKATEVGQETIKCLTLILFLHRYTYQK